MEMLSSFDGNPSMSFGYKLVQTNGLQIQFFRLQKMILSYGFIYLDDLKLKTIMRNTISIWNNLIQLIILNKKKLFL